MSMDEVFCLPDRFIIKSLVAENRNIVRFDKLSNMTCFAVIPIVEFSIHSHFVSFNPAYFF